MTEERLLEIISSRDISTASQVRELFQADLKATLQELENKALKREKKYDAAIGKINIALEGHTNGHERLFERTNTLFDSRDEIKDRLLPQMTKDYNDQIKGINESLEEIKRHQSEGRGAMKLYGSVCIGVVAFGAVATCLIALLS